MDKFFDIVVCLTLKERYDRQQWFEDHADEIGLSFEWFYALKNDNPKISFCESQIAMLKWFLSTGKETVLCLEDDCVFQNLEVFNECINQLPKDWYMVYLGANVTKAKRYSKNLRRLKDALTTHAVGYTRKAAETIVREYEYQEGQLYDTWLSLNIGRWPVYITYPMLAIQRPNYSDLWERDVDYLDIWDDSENYLKRLG